MAATRKGKVASLPATVREEVNRRLFDGERAPTILKWLHEQPEVLRVLDDLWKEEPVTAQNLSEWRQGGYQDWLGKRESVENTKLLAEYAFKLARAGGGSMSEGAAAIAGGRILELLEQVARGEKPVATNAAGDEVAVDFDLEKLVNAVATLGHVEVAHKKETRQQKALELDVQRFQRQTAEMFMKFYKDNRAKEIMDRKGDAEVKTQDLVKVMFGEKPEA